MVSDISRRDFLNGTAIAIGAGMLAPTAILGTATSASPLPSNYYPPTLTGLRGSHVGSFEVAHALAWNGEKPATYKNTGEHYDLVIVGGGISGLATARFYQLKNGMDAKILILENHDDFGGHAKRNEFHHDGRMLLGIGGAQNLEGPSAYSDEAKSLFADLGMGQDEFDQMADNTSPKFAMGSIGTASSSISIKTPDGHVTIGKKWLDIMNGDGDIEGTVQQMPIPQDQREKLKSLFKGDVDFLDHMSLGETYDYVQTNSYNQFLTEHVGLTQETIQLFETTPLIFMGFTTWNLSVLECFAMGLPGLQSIGWLPSILHSLGRSLGGSIFESRYFPDGNASVARLLVHKIIPSTAPAGTNWTNIAKARIDYSALDRPTSPTKVRLNSTVVGVKATGDDTVKIDYVTKGEALNVTADHTVLACYNSLIPHLCPDLPEEQKEALRYQVKVPFVYANVVLDNGHAFAKLDDGLIHCPNDPFQMITTAPNTTSGGYEPPRSADDPMVMFMMCAPTPAPENGESLKELLRIGRHTVYATPFETYEQQIREQLQSILGVYGFDHERDIKAITVNRIPHGYAYEYVAVEDPEWPEGQAPHEIARKQFGRISIANSDSEARAYIDAAMDAAFRAVEEQTKA